MSKAYKHKLWFLHKYRVAFVVRTPDLELKRTNLFDLEKSYQEDRNQIQ